MNLLRPRGVVLTPWEESEIAGRFIGDCVLANIDNGDTLVADVTVLNFNVAFEIGYAIGRGKRCLLIRCSALRSSDAAVREIGIFDTLGYQPYTTAQELADWLASSPRQVATPPVAEINTAAPVYVVMPKIKTDLEIRILSRMKKARLNFRTFDAEEQGRLSASDAVDSVARSHGVVIPLLSDVREGAQTHNIRGAFVAGLALGMDKVLLLLQDGEEPVPLDYRDFVTPIRFPDQVDEKIAEFSPAISARLQTRAAVLVAEPRTLLQRVTFGASSAENELQELGNYYLETDEFNRAMRGEARIVAGKKGSGKTALFAQLRDRLRRDKARVVLDLKPEGFQLLKFKGRVLDYLDEGTREHTVTAFWEYLLLLEICHKLLEKDREAHLRDQNLFQPYRRLVEAYHQDDYVSEGDFAERMLKLTQRIGDDFDAGGQAAGLLTSGKVTELIYAHDLAVLRTDVCDYLSRKRELWVLFDNLDKGWPPHGITPHDVLVLRSLIDAMAKLERELNKRGITAHGVVFIRNDVLQILCANTPDRGKTSSVDLDWTDPDLLRELLRRRLVFGEFPPNTSFEDAWYTIAASHYKGEETSQYLIDRCLMRPRALIELLRHCRSHAVNLGHTKIEAADFAHGEEAYSADLLTNLDFEIRDVSGCANVLYEFLECPAILNGESVRQMLVAALGEDRWEHVLHLLVWFGFLGLERTPGEATYIYSVRYDMTRMDALVRRRPLAETAFAVNPAFWQALEVEHTPT